MPEEHQMHDADRITHELDLSVATGKAKHTARAHIILFALTVQLRGDLFFDPLFKTKGTPETHLTP
eukprot:6457922-Amphidinium_carterae.1